MPISVYLKQQDPLQDCAPHETSRRTAVKLLALSVARPVGQNAIQLIPEISWKEAKNLIRYGSVTVQEVEAGTAWSLLPPRDWYYPWTDLPLWMIRGYGRHEFTA
jgi:hypothetical protein